MKISTHSQQRFYDSFKQWEVDRDYWDPMYNYLIHGYSPGSFFTAVLANDFRTAMACSHPGNTVTALKKLVGWMNDHMPGEAIGDYERVDNWCQATDSERRPVLEAYRLIYTEKEEMWLSIKESA